MIANAKRSAGSVLFGLMLGAASTITAAAQDATLASKLASKPRDSAGVFISGHSLTANPLGNDLEAIARSLGKSIHWNQQLYIGSPIRARTSTPPEGRWVGRLRGTNKAGQSGVDVANELRTGASVGGRKYDTLLITERHDTVSVIVWEDTTRELRDYHEQLIANAADGQTYFLEPWWGISDKNDPSSWMAYERAASAAWQCVVNRINTSLEAEGRSDRILSLPAGAAIVELIERAIAGKIPDLKAANTRAVVDRVISDDVHLTRTGTYYLAALSYSAIFRQSPTGAWAPDSMPKSLATALQELAWTIVSSYYANYKPQSLAQCRAMMRDSFCAHWNQMMPKNQQPGCARLFSREDTSGGPGNPSNPFYFDRASDRNYWLPPAPK